MKNESMIAAWNKLNPDEEGKGRIMDQVSQLPKKCRPRLRPAMVAAMTAVLCLAMLGGLFALPENGNFFSVKAYAVEPQGENALGLREMDVLDQPEIWGGHFDGENFYVNVGLQFEGENIQSVCFSVEDGFFAKQYISDYANDDTVSKMYVGPENRLVMVGKEFEIVGNEITLDDTEATEDLLLFWGTKAKNIREVPASVEIIAMATFFDGSTQTRPITIDLSGTGTASGNVFSEEENRQLDAWFEYYDSLSVSQCELIPESVRVVTDVFEFGWEGSMSYHYIDDNYRDPSEYDEDGFYRCGVWPSADGELFISGLRIDENGVLTGMEYRVPDHLAKPLWEK